LRQPVLVSQNPHLPVPSQVPLKPQVVCAVATQRPLVSAPAAGIGEQVPSLPVTLQLKQVPFVASAHVVSQQTPSPGQLPLRHWLPAVQALPLFFFPHEPLLQVLGLMQSALLVQLPLHDPVPVSHT
jgi:hypothetical protein